MQTPATSRSLRPPVPPVTTRESSGAHLEAPIITIVEPTPQVMQGPTFADDIDASLASYRFGTSSRFQAALDDDRLADPAADGGWVPTRRASWATAEGSFQQAMTLLPSAFEYDADPMDETEEASNTLAPLRSTSRLGARRRSTADASSEHQSEWDGLDLDSRRRPAGAFRRTIAGRESAVSMAILREIADRARGRRASTIVHATDQSQ
jgi:hypothetical protein